MDTHTRVVQYIADVLDSRAARAPFHRGGLTVVDPLEVWISIREGRSDDP